MEKWNDIRLIHDLLEKRTECKKPKLHLVVRVPAVAWTYNIPINFFLTMFKSVAVGIALLTASASAMIPDPSSTGSSIPANSLAGRKLLRKARALEEQHQQQQQPRDDPSWMANYYFKYMGCNSLVQLHEEAEGGGGGGGGGNGDASNEYTLNMVRFGLCPNTEPCGSCTEETAAAEYLVDMTDFLMAYIGFQMDAKEQICETIRENCDCENVNDYEACEQQCYQDLGKETCIEGEGPDDLEMVLRMYLECLGK